MQHNFEKPLYSIYPRIYCSGTILIDDVPVVDWYGDETREGGYGGDTMINQAILQSGKYMVVGKLFPREGETTLSNEELMAIEFLCAEKTNWKNSRYQFSPKIESSWDGLSENINYPHFEIRTEIEVTVPYKIKGWKDSVNLKDIEEKKLFEEVYNFYKKLHAVLKNHDVTQFLELSSDKLALQQEALYFDEMRKQSFSEGANQLFGQNLEVADLNHVDLKLEIIGNGKLVRLIKFDGSHPLQFKSSNLEKQSNIEIEIKLHKKSDKDGFSII